MDFFSSCSCCTRDYNEEDWRFVRYIHSDMFAPFVYDVELCLRAPYGEEVRVWKEEFEFVDLDEVKRIVEEYKEKWNKGFHIPMRTDLNKDSIKNKS